LFESLVLLACSARRELVAVRALIGLAEGTGRAYNKYAKFTPGTSDFAQTPAVLSVYCILNLSMLDLLYCVFFSV